MVEMQGLAIPDGGEGFVNLCEWLSQTFCISVDNRAGKKGVRVSTEGAGVPVFSSSTTAGGTVPEGTFDLVVTTTLDDGTGSALWAIYVDGSRVGDVVSAPAPATPVFSTNRELVLLQGGYGVSVGRIRVFGGSFAEGYAADGDPSALRLLPGHDIAAADFNTGLGAIVKKGADAFSVS